MRTVVKLDPALQGPYQIPVANSEVKDEIIESNGKRLVAAYANGNVIVARYNADNSLDLSFGGGDGKSVNDLGTNSDRILDMSLRPDGRIMLINVTGGSGDAWQFEVTRLNPDGTLDKTFAVEGKLFSGLGRASGYGGVSMILDDGRIHITGWDGTKSKAMEYDADGKNGFDRLNQASAPLRAASLPTAPARPQEGTLNYFAQGESIGPEAPQTMPMYAQANPSVNEGSDYLLPLSKGNGWTIKWDQNHVSTEPVSGHPASALHQYPDGPATHTITATSKSIYLQGNENLMPATTQQVIQADTLTMAAGTTLDLNDNDLIVNSGDFSTIQASVFEGYSGGPDTTKTGIISSTSQNVHGGTTILALFDNALAGLTDWPQGSGLTLDPNAIVGKYTYLGDTNMDGMVAPQDYTAIDANLGTTGLDPGIAWFYGDTNFSTDVTPQDYTAIDAALGLGVGNPLTVSGRYDSPVRLSQDVDVENVAPTVTISGSNTGAVGTPITLTGNPSDPSSVDQASVFLYTWTVTKGGSQVATGTTKNFTFTPGVAGNYQVNLLATDKDGGSGSQNFEIQAGNTTVLAAPTNVQADASALNELKVTWSYGSAGQSGFRVYRSQNSGAYIAIGEVDPTTREYADASPILASTASYRYTVVATAAGGGESPLSVPSQATSPVDFGIAVSSVDDEPGDVFDPYKPVTITFSRTSQDASDDISFVYRFGDVTDPSEAIPDIDIDTGDPVTYLGSGRFLFELAANALTATLTFTPVSSGFWFDTKAMHLDLLELRKKRTGTTTNWYTHFQDWLTETNIHIKQSDGTEKQLKDTTSAGLKAALQAAQSSGTLITALEITGHADPTYIALNNDETLTCGGANHPRRRERGHHTTDERRARTQCDNQVARLQHRAW